VLVGVLFLGEALKPSHLYALALILGGVLATQLERTHGNCWAGR
jgi:drug/metabolite transporter (DMT)-like permease